MALSANAASTTNATNANRLMDPRVVARNGGLAFEVDGGSDIIMSRIGKDTTRCAFCLCGHWCLVVKVTQACPFQ